MKKCADCEFWEQRKELTGAGNCHKNPPTPVIEKGRMLAMWGLSKSDDWCGEFKNKQPAATPGMEVI